MTNLFPPPPAILMPVPQIHHLQMDLLLLSEATSALSPFLCDKAGDNLKYNFCFWNDVVAHMMHTRIYFRLLACCFEYNCCLVLNILVLMYYALLYILFLCYLLYYAILIFEP